MRSCEPRQLEVRPDDATRRSPPAAPLQLSVREFGLLVALARRAGRIVSREELYDRRLGRARCAPATARSTSTSTSCAPSSSTRCPSWRFIHTHVGFGYRFAAEPSHAFHKTATTSITDCAAAPWKRGAGIESSDPRRSSVRSRKLARPRGDRRPGRRRRRLRQQQRRARHRPRAAATSGGTINGAGATFPQPVYDQWAAPLQGASRAPRSTTSPIGSGGGIAQFTAGTVDFGATDAAMKDEEVTAAEKKGTPVHVPMVFGAVTVSYNLVGRREGPEARRRDDRRHLPRQDQEVERPGDRRRRTPASTLPAPTSRSCHRSDESGTTKLLHRRSWPATAPEWESRSGSDKTVKWPTGTGAKGNDGVAACVKQTHGRGRLRRAGLRAAEQLHDRRREEQGRQLRRADARVDVRGRRRREGARRTCASARSTRPARRPTRSPRRRS